MAEFSAWWTTSGTPSGHQQSAYTQAHLSTIAEILASVNGQNTIVMGYLSDLAVTSPSSLTSRVAAGAAVVDGKAYKNDANKDLTHDSTPSFRADRIILRCDWAGFQVTALIKKGTDGSTTPPTLTQTAGTTYEISLAKADIDSGGNVVLTDERSFALDNVTIERVSSQLRVKDDSISNAKLRNSSALSVIGRASNSTGDPADIAAGTDGHVLRRSGTALGFGQILAAALANDIVDDTKVGNRVPQFYRRQGGSSSNWSAPGSAGQTPTTVRIQAGVISWTGSLNWSGNVTVTFPVAFSNAPIVLATAINASASRADLNISADTPSASAVTLHWEDASHDTYTSIDIAWLAIGPE